MLALLFLVGLRVAPRRRVRRLGVALRLIEFVLTLLVLVGLLVAPSRRRHAAARSRFVLRALDRGLLVALLARVARAARRRARVVPCESAACTAAHAVARLVQTVIHEELAVAVVLRDAVTVVVLLGALVQRLCRASNELSSAAASLALSALPADRSPSSRSPCAAGATLRGHRRARCALGDGVCAAAGAHTPARRPSRMTRMTPRTSRSDDANLSPPRHGTRPTP